LAFNFNHCGEFNAMTNPNPNIYVDGVEVLAPCVYTADSAGEAINNLTIETYEAADKAWKTYGSGKSKILTSTPDSFMDDIAEAFKD
jgi:hypothetical protein